MSHVVQIQTEVRDPVAVRSACNRLGLPEPLEGVHRLFSEEAEGLGVKLPEWRYPVVCELATGRLRYDDFGGRWGERKHLDALLQRYAVEKASLEARKAGHTVAERLLADGAVKLTIQVGASS